MLPASVRLWRLGTAGDGNLGLCCNRDGLFLGRTALIERRAGCYVLRPQSDLERLLKRAFDGADLDRLMRGLAVVKSALDESNLCLAQIAAVQLRIPDLPGFRARAALESEDLPVKFERGGDVLARAGWDPDEHPRAGTPPNPGWFAATEAGSAQEHEHGGRAPRGVFHPALPAADNAGGTLSPILPVTERSTGNPNYGAHALRMDRNVLSRILHEMKRDAGLAGTTMWR